MRSNKHRIAAYNSIIEQLTSRGHNVDLQVMDNEPRTAYRQLAEGTKNSTYQLVPPNVHSCNAAKHAIRTFKAYF